MESSIEPANELDVVTEEQFVSEPMDMLSSDKDSTYSDNALESSPKGVILSS
jgi:hypothetical protein